ncbi:glycerol uptake facilitator-like aquaporin [Rhizobium lentis]|uniref:Glycerol uptake facilitator-like aquaporin n=1 Tax=Rhizobium lentis TaxID=1138194 RepID=A0A7W9CXV6_9HYPH|nr:glycerol uptake facilitator-like aquaporin [Rhizobium lentis]MBB5553078.1 glycerol uptake facilitator-like aquaporin [Rhizobium lentis]MBB5563865.1 glycerol uptake facilitator-like aquaporin [Rhizobium lentis]MBB5570397.1 glycerol uptake facilitator-like aquaporin [Rhizobium lentis]
MKKYVCEFFGTFTLVFLGCGTLLYMRLEVGLLGVALAFGMTVVAMAYTIGPVSGAHLNPAVSLGFLVSRRLRAWDFVGYASAQCAELSRRRARSTLSLWKRSTATISP